MASRIVQGEGRPKGPRAGRSPRVRGGVKHRCEASDLFRLLGKSYVLDLLYVFLHEEPGPKRFVGLQKRLSMSPNTLSDRLKELVQAGFLTRTSYNEIPPRVDYEATAKAHDLGPVFESLTAWAEGHNLKPEPLVKAEAAALA